MLNGPFLKYEKSINLALVSMPVSFSYQRAGTAAAAAAAAVLNTLVVFIWCPVLDPIMPPREVPPTANDTKS